MPEQLKKSRMSRTLRTIFFHVAFFAGVFCLIGLLIALRVADPLVIQNARATAFDLLQRSEPREYIDAGVRIVDIDERSLEELGQWPWPRDRLAEMVDRLHAAGAATVAFDFLFVEPDRMSSSRLLDDPRIREALGSAVEDARTVFTDNDEIFADAITRGRVVLGFATSPRTEGLPEIKAGFAYTGDNPAQFATSLRGGGTVLPLLEAAADGIGTVNVSSDFSIGVVREAPLVWSAGDQIVPSLYGEALRVAQGAQTYVVHADGDGGIQSVRIGAFEVPTTPTGELYLHYTPTRPDRYVSAVDLFDDDRLRSLVPLLQGRIVLVGTSAPGLFDLHKTALGEVVPGVEIQAQAIEQIINKQFLTRQDWAHFVEWLALAAAGIIASATTMYGGPRISLLIGGSIAAMIVVGAWYMFRSHGVLLDFSFPLMGSLAIWFVSIGFRYIVADKEKRKIRHAFGHYVHPSVLQEIERNHSVVELGGENCELTVLFTDVRGFTPLSERLAPDELVRFLNTLLGRLSDEITQEAGVIDKYIGDSVMAFWNAPLRQEDHARHACFAALNMRAAIREMSSENAFGLPDEVYREFGVSIGVGINTGPACVGNVGSAERFDYSAIGDAVNVAARAESASKELAYDLVVCRSTADLAADLAFLEAGGVPLKGKTKPVELAILVGDAAMKASPEFTEFAEHYHALIEALQEGDPVRREAVFRRCRALANALEAGLDAYLVRLLERRSDFISVTDPQESLASIA